jgi:predicted Fe-Mo cluster-binding NifX family protein
MLFDKAEYLLKSTKISTEWRARSMRVAITSQGESLESRLDRRFGRAAFFVAVNTETGEFAVHDNTQNLNAAQGAGIQAGSNVVGLNVEALITGNVGPKAYAVLKAAGIRIYLAPDGTVAESLQRFKDGLLDECLSANVAGHWI